MAEPSFIQNEKISNSTGIFALNVRLFKSLPLFLKLLPLSILTIFLSSAAPSIFRWYSGNFCNSTGPLFVPGLNKALPFTLLGLVLITFLGAFFRILAWGLFEISGMWSSQNLHHKMVKSMTLTRTTFFDENPSGRLINRLVKDFDEVRSTAIIFVGDFFNAIIEVFGIAIVASFANSWVGALMLPVLLVFAYIQSQRSSMLEHSRTLAAVATSQVIGRKTDLIDGREIFLLYNRGEQLLKRMSQSFRVYVQAATLNGQIEAWASFWARVSAEVFSLGVLIFVAIRISNGEIETALAGVIISSLFGITGSMGWLDFATALISTSASHVRRVFEFVDLPEEKDQEGKPGRSHSLLAPYNSSDSFNDIIFKAYTMSYRLDTPLILENLNLRIQGGQKTALIGRTGSGKTSLIQALLRMVYVHQGDVLIGGQSIFSLNLRDLRRLFGVVPQFPYLFAGTISSNLDRVGALSRNKLKGALEIVGLKYSLDHSVIEGGQNLSIGERQLICLARVIAADRKIILMDEPTSGLDPHTDARITQVFNTAFENKTVLTIAHRPESLVHYDKVIEMHAGHCKSE